VGETPTQVIVTTPVVLEVRVAVAAVHFVAVAAALAAAAVAVVIWRVLGVRWAAAAAVAESVPVSLVLLAAVAAILRDPASPESAVPALLFYIGPKDTNHEIRMD
jgi:hypothetical protein